MARNPTKIKIKIKPKLLYDEYVLTNKHIICKFKYIVACFDCSGDSSNLSNGFVTLTIDRLKESFSEQGISFNSTQDDGHFVNILKNMREWHPLISKIEMDSEEMYAVNNLHDYPINWSIHEPYFKTIPDNKCIDDDQKFSTFKGCYQIVSDIKVYFQLVRRIEKIDDLHINFQYAHKLLNDNIMAWNEEKSIYLDEVSVKKNQIPFSHNNEMEEPCYVYPYMYLIPLYPTSI